MNLALRFLETAKRLRAKAAVCDDPGQHTFGELLAAANAIAARLRPETAREHVGILAPTSAAFPIAFFGTLLADKVAVPLNPRLDPKLLAFFVEDAGLDAIVATRAFAPLVEALGVRGIFIADSSSSSSSPSSSSLDSSPLGPTRGDGDAATLLYTTGTTGTPKGVVLTHRNLLRNAESCHEHIGITEADVFLAVLPFFHSFGLTTSMLIPLLGGNTTVCVARFSALRVFQAIAQHRVTCCFAVPAMYAELVRTGRPPGLDLSCVKILVAGGEPLRAGLADPVRELFGVPLLNGYGLTETSPVATVNQPGANRPGSAGRLLPWVEARVVDEQDRPLALGDEGELWLRGECVTPGYHNRPADTAAAFTPDGWFRTGDLARLDADGCLWITGRKKDLIIRAGEKIVPTEIEAVLCEHPAVAEAAVIGVPDATHGEVPKAFVVFREGAAAEAADLAAFCRERLPRYKLPAAFEVRAELPRTQTGKVHKLALRQEETCTSDAVPRCASR